MQNRQFLKQWICQKAEIQSFPDNNSGRPKYIGFALDVHSRLPIEFWISASRIEKSAYAKIDPALFCFVFCFLNFVCLCLLFFFFNYSFKERITTDPESGILTTKEWFRQKKLTHHTFKSRINQADDVMPSLQKLGERSLPHMHFLSWYTTIRSENKTIIPLCLRTSNFHKVFTAPSI